MTEERDELQLQTRSAALSLSERTSELTQAQELLQRQTAAHETQLSQLQTVIASLNASLEAAQVHMHADKCLHVILWEERDLY